MKLPTHDRYDYVPLRGRQNYVWPGNRGLAVYFALNLEHFCFGEGLGAELAPGGPQPDVLNFAWRDWGNRVGAWYMLDAFDALDLPMAALVAPTVTVTGRALLSLLRMWAWRRGGEMGPGSKLLVEPTDAHVTLLHPPGHDYYRILRSKLHWGRGAHPRDPDRDPSRSSIDLED